MNALTFPGPDRRESERRAAASATEFARGQKFGRHEADELVARLTAERDALASAIRRKVDDAEQAVFEAWLERVAPGGDVEQVQHQWVLTVDFEEHNAEWAWARAALASIKQGGAA